MKAYENIGQVLRNHQEVINLKIQFSRKMYGVEFVCREDLPQYRPVGDGANGK
jgi:hypothetical protein